MKTISLILARGGSKGIPNKNIIDLNGNPLLYYTTNASLNSNVNETWVSTDCDKIKKVAQIIGCKVIDRPKEISGDNSKSDEALVHFAENVDFDIVNNTVKFENTRTGSLKFKEKLPDPPFFVKINQLLDSRFYSNNSFYVGGSEMTVTNTGSLTAGVVNDIPLHVEPRRAEFVKLFIDGVEKSTSQFTVNLNSGSARDANINYTPASGEAAYRTKIDHYTVPVIEVGDNVELAFNNTYSVINTSFDPASAKYNAALTANTIYRVELAESPTINAIGLSFVNISPDPSGSLGNISGNTATVDYNQTTFPGTFNLGNNRVYNIEVGGEFEKTFLAENLVIPDLEEGTTTVRARNRNMLGRLSPTTTKSITVSTIPIRKVTNLVITESLYREQTGGVAIRVTCAFDHIVGQEVTDYEISYRLDNIDNIGTDDGGADLTAFNTVKVPATGVDSDGKIRFTVSGINRGISSDTNSVFFRVTPLNKSIRGDTANVSKSILGKTSKPSNIFNFTGGQNTDQITLLWQYQRQTSGDLLDLDLKEVVIRRSPGSIAFTEENFINTVTELLSDAGIYEDIEIKQYRHDRRGIKLDGFNWNPLERILSIFVIKFSNTGTSRLLCIYCARSIIIVS